MLRSLFLTGVLLLVACTAVEPSPSGPTNTPVPPTPTNAPVPTPTRTPNLTPLPSPTPLPTFTPTPTPRPTATPTPYPIGAGLDRYDRSLVNIVTRLGLDIGFRGSGVVISTDPRGAAYILTAYHVVDETPQGIEVSIAGKYGAKSFPAEIEVYDAELDIALLSVCCSPVFLAAELVQEGIPQRGDRVYAVAYEDNGQVVASSGEIIGIRGLNEIGSDVEVERGYSGGALVTAGEYKIIGILTGIHLGYEASVDTPSLESRAFMEELGFWWPPDTTIAIWLHTIVNDLELGNLMGLPPTPTPTPSPTPTPRPTPTPIELTLVEYLDAVTPIALELARIMGEEIDSTFILQDPNSPQRRKVTTQLLAVADSITEVQGVPATCQDHYGFLSRMAARIYEFRDDQLPSTLLALANEMTAMGDRAQGFYC